tara:strand:+ start:11495 stop:12055 length:561 start_codon:yes stop_codon:yes gene_type:complete
MRNYDRIIDYCIEHKITVEQYMVLHLLFCKKISTIKLYANTFPHKKGKFLSEKDRDDLIDRDYLIREIKGFSLGNKFKDIYADKFTAGNELWCLYPGFVRKKDGTMIPLTSMSKQIFRVAYWDAIDGDRIEHEAIMKDVEYGIKHYLLNFGIKKFLEAEYWTKLRDLRLSKSNNLNNLSTQTDDDF